MDIFGERVAGDVCRTCVWMRDRDDSDIYRFDLQIYLRINHGGEGTPIYRSEEMIVGNYQQYP